MKRSTAALSSLLFGALLAPPGSQAQNGSWGITAVDSPAVQEEPENILNFVIGWGWGQGLLKSGSRIVLITGTNWSAERHDMMLIHVVS